MLASIALLALAAPASDFLAGCTALRHSKGWQYQCDELFAHVMDEERISPDSRTGMEAGVAAGFGDQVERREVRLQVSGQSVKAVRLTDLDRNGGKVKCGPNSFASWARVLDEPMAKRALEALLAEVTAGFEAHGIVTRRTDVSCAIAGVATRCVRIRGIADRQPFVFLVGAADAGGWTLASCVAPALEDKPCRTVFSKP